MIDYEKLGVFYLGRNFDMARGEVKPDYLLYDSKDLTTHAVIVGMTGSGKTGLGVTLLEEAAIDGIPAIIIDPKGDMGNLMMSFPDLKPADFTPWVNREEASRQGMSPKEYAGHLAKLWRNGLGEWDQAVDRITRLRDAAEVSIYTPGSDAGIPLTVLKSFDAPPAAVINSSDAMRESVSAAVSGLLTLLGVSADPIRSREHVLVSKIVDQAWRKGESLTLSRLIREIHEPPFDKVGIMDLESIFPAKDRLELAMTINNVLASPGFAGWMQGEPLNIQRLLYSPEGKPRLAVLSIAHLNDQERMFFVTILLNEVINWMRSQPGTSSLRALLYMDEVFGYLPPVANPPTKRPMLTLLKQARAFGLGLVLSTQNPVDLDYKALSNAGTWFLGRLQTERDKQRVLDGLEGASSAAGVTFDRQRIENILSGVGKRVFLMNNVHEDAPVTFQTRWALSYLSGPLTRDQIERLMADQKATRAVQQKDATANAGGQSTPAAGITMPDGAGDEHPPIVPASIEQLYLEADDVRHTERVIYRPALFGQARMHFTDAKSDLDTWMDVVRICPCKDEVPRNPWDESDSPEFDSLAFDRSAFDGGRFASLPVELTRAKEYKSWSSMLKSHLYQEHRLMLSRCVALKLYSLPGETEGDFRVRIKDELREKRDTEIEKLRRKYASKMERLHERIRKAGQKVDVEREQAKSAGWSAAISFGQSILGAVLGRKTISATSARGMGTSARAASRAAQQRSDIGRAEEDLRSLQEDFDDLERELEHAIDEISESLSFDAVELEEYPVKPRKSDISIDRVALLWMPWRVDSDGVAEPAFV